MLVACGVVIGCGAAVAARTAEAQAPMAVSDGRDADRAAIRAHIESIFQAFIDGDVKKIHDTHSEDWFGFLDTNGPPIQGIDRYMRANGITWPPAPRPAPATTPASPTPPPSAPAGTRGYYMTDFTVEFYGPDMAIACFFGGFNRTVNGVTTVTSKLRLMDIYGRRNGQWIQVGSHTVVDPQWRAEQIDLPATPPPPIRQRILDAREALWRAYFANDRAVLEQRIPAEAIAMDDADAWRNRDAILAGAASVAASGARLTRLEFPKTEMQIYGDVIILYTTYRYDLDVNGVVTTTTGRGTEVFVQRKGTFVNTGWQLEKDK
jgi:hypothetical protein